MLDSYVDAKSTAKCILIVEKDAIFQRLAEVSTLQSHLGSDKHKRIVFTIPFHASCLPQEVCHFVNNETIIHISS